LVLQQTVNLSSSDM
jgi:hypothetical protein